MPLEPDYRLRCRSGEPNNKPEFANIVAKEAAGVRWSKTFIQVFLVENPRIGIRARQRSAGAYSVAHDYWMYSKRAALDRGWCGTNKSEQRYAAADPVVRFPVLLAAGQLSSPEPLSVSKHCFEPKLFRFPAPCLRTLSPIPSNTSLRQPYCHAGGRHEHPCTSEDQGPSC